MASTKSYTARSSSSSFARSDIASNYDVLSVTDHDLESNFSGSETPPSPSNRGVRCRIQWLGDASLFLVPLTIEPNSQLVVVKANERAPSNSEWVLEWCDDSPDCAIRSARHETHFICGAHLGASKTQMNLCQVQPPPNSATSVTWSDVEEEWACIINLGTSRLSASVESGNKAMLISGVAPVTKRDIWRIQLLHELEPIIVNPVPPVPKPQSANPLLNGRRCLILTHHGRVKLFLQAGLGDSLQGSNWSTTAKPTEWIVTSSEGNYTVGLAGGKQYLTVSPTGKQDVQLGPTASKWIVKRLDEPPKTTFGLSNIIEQWSCVIHPATRSNLLFRLEDTKPVLADIPPIEDMSKRHKWRIYFLDETTVSGSPIPTEPEGVEPRAPKSSSGSSAPSVADPELCIPSKEPSLQPPTSSGAESICGDGEILSALNSENGISPKMGRPDSTAPQTPKVTSTTVSELPPHVLNWVNTQTMSSAGPIEPETDAATPKAYSVSGAETPRQVRSPQLKATPFIDDTASHQSSQEPTSKEPDDSIPPASEPRACHIQHVLTGTYLTSVSDTIGLTVELDDANVWFVQPAGPGYILVMPSVNNTAPAQHLAPKRGDPSGKIKLGFSDYPAPWDLSPKQDRFSTTSTIGDVEWICKIRWPFTGELIVAESTRNCSANLNDGDKGIASLWVDQERATELCLKEFWRVQFLA